MHSWKPTGRLPSKALQNLGRRMLAELEMQALLVSNRHVQMGDVLRAMDSGDREAAMPRFRQHGFNVLGPILDASRWTH